MNGWTGPQPDGGRGGSTPSRRAGFWERLAWAIWILLVVGSLGRTVLYERYASARGCYAVFADGGRHWLRGEGLYDSAHPNSLDVFRYSPLTAVACVPLGLCPDPVGSALLRAASLIVLTAGFWWWGRTVLPPTLSREKRAVAWLLCAGMGCTAMMDVQLNLLTIGFILIAAAAASQARWNTAAVAVSIACCLKAYPVALALVLAAAYPRRFAPRWLAALALCLAVPFLCRQPDYVWRQYGDWLRWGLNSRRPEDPANAFQDVTLVCSRWLQPISVRTYLGLELAAGAAVAAVCVGRRLWQTPLQDLLPLITVLCCGWMMAFGPSTEATTYVQMAPVVAVVTLFAWVTPQRIWFRALVTISCALLTLSELQLLLPLHKPLHQWTAQPLAVLLLMAAAAVNGMGSRGKAEESGAVAPRPEWGANRPAA